MKNGGFQTFVPRGRHVAVAEQAVRAAAGGTRAILEASGLPLHFWSFASEVWAHNHNLTCKGDFAGLFKDTLESRGSPSSPVVMGQLCWAKLPETVKTESKSKAAPAASPCALLGYGGSSRRELFMVYLNEKRKLAITSVDPGKSGNAVEYSKPQASGRPTMAFKKVYRDLKSLTVPTFSNADDVEHGYPQRDVKEHFVDEEKREVEKTQKYLKAHAATIENSQTAGKPRDGEGDDSGTRVADPTAADAPCDEKLKSASDGNVNSPTARPACDEGEASSAFDAFQDLLSAALDDETWMALVTRKMNKVERASPLGQDALAAEMHKICVKYESFGKPISASDARVKFPDATVSNFALLGFMKNIEKTRKRRDALWCWGIVCGDLTAALCPLCRLRAS